MKNKNYIFLAFLLLFICLPKLSKAQAPEKFSYQTILRDADDEFVSNTLVGMKISILQGTAEGAPVYEETQTPTTDANGLVSIEIGTGSVESGSFAGINWANGPYFIKTETAIVAPLTTYTIVGTSQLLTTPYVMHANTVGGTYTQPERDALTPYEGMIIYNSTTKKPNYYNGTEWMNYDGTSAKTLAIGDEYQGGIIAYILQDGDPGYVEGEVHGLIAAPSDQSSGAGWGCEGTLIGGTSSALGSGAANTSAIVTGCETTEIAAQICNDLDLNGYSDWFLPSKDELEKLYINREAIGGFASVFYWSSSEESSSIALDQSFEDGAQSVNGKNVPQRVRAVRAF